ncbi:MAG TPA: hypothetical protein VF945_04665, partial [Polyangia bacterium]
MTTYLYVQDLLAGAHVLEVGSESGGDFLRARGARSVGRAAADGLAALPAGEFDVAFALDVEPAQLKDTAAAMRRVVKAEGTVVLAVPSRDRPGARAGASYYELVDLFEPMFPSVKMIGQAPFAGATLVEYGAADPDPVLDGTLVPKGERVEWYVVVGGPKRPGARGYGVMQVPMADVGALPAERRTAPQPEPKRAAPPVPVAAAPVVAPKPQPQASDEELKQLVAAAQKGKAELQKFVLELQAQLAERDAYVAELDQERREIARLREEARRAAGRADKAEAAERETRKKLA